MSNINIKRAVENIRSGTTVYTPIVELIVNGIQAVRAIKETGGQINVTVLRTAENDLLDELAAVDGFVVDDDGIGFDQTHRDAFDTLYTELKAADGGKGFGRFTCLKYFEHLHVDSVFRHDSKFQRRTFSMGTGNDIIIDEKIVPAVEERTGARVEISGLKGVKTFPDKGLDVIARVLVEKLLPYFIDPTAECPRIIISDNSSRPPIVLNDYLSQEDRRIVELKVDGSDITLPAPDGPKQFSVRVFKFYVPKGRQSKISLVAHRREVTEISIQTYIPEFADEFYEKGDDAPGGKDLNYIIKGYVLGPYLDTNVSLERGAFNFQRDNDLMYGISQSQIEQAAAEVARKAVGEEVTARRERKRAKIAEYVETNAPWHRAIAEDADFSRLPMNPSPEEIETHLQTAKFQKELKVRADVQLILTSPASEELRTKVAEVVKNISQTSTNDLIHYVSLRRCVLDLFERALEIDGEGKYRSEGDVHDIIMPRKKDSLSLDYEQHNLWMLDERLNFTTYVASDKPLDGGHGDRTDITIFNRRIVFRGDNEPSNPIIIFEFKKPQRHDFANPSSDEDPVQQIVRYVNEIREGKHKTPKGRDIAISTNTNFYGYVVCDLTKKVKTWLHDEKDFTEMPDGLGWFRWYGNIKLYVEVLSWTKILNDAKMRNRIFFHKLNI